MNELEKPLIVIKIGSSSIVKHEGNNTDIDLNKISGLCKSINELRDSGHRVILVSSGAVAAGTHIVGIERPKSNDLKGLAACAAIGQPQLMTLYSKFAKELGFIFAQVLLTRSDFHDQDALDYLERTFESLFELGVVPLVNENDVVSNRELNFGDNDGISALITILLKADKFVLLTDQEGLLDKDPNEHDDAKLIEDIDVYLPSMVDQHASMSEYGSGGHGTKVAASDLATYACADLVAHIANSKKADSIVNILNSTEKSTRIKAKNTGLLSPIEAYEIFGELEKGRQEGRPLAKRGRIGLRTKGVQQIIFRNTCN